MNFKFSEIKIDTASFSVVSGFEEAEKLEMEYYRSISPESRLEIIESLRKTVYGDNPEGFQRVLTVTRRE